MKAQRNSPNIVGMQVDCWVKLQRIDFGWQKHRWKRSSWVHFHQSSRKCWHIGITAWGFNWICHLLSLRWEFKAMSMLWCWHSCSTPLECKLTMTPSQYQGICQWQTFMLVIYNSISGGMLEFIIGNKQEVCKLMQVQHWCMAWDFSLSQIHHLVKKELDYIMSVMLTYGSCNHTGKENKWEYKKDGMTCHASFLYPEVNLQPFYFLQLSQYK